jgi:hypothetical protein
MPSQGQAAERNAVLRDLYTSQPKQPEPPTIPLAPRAHIEHELDVDIGQLASGPQAEEE